MMHDELQRVTPSREQKEAIAQTQGACMVLAGPGSGKTYVLTQRILECLKEPGVRPWHILALTFTNKAAREMTERVERCIGDEVRQLWIGTFHRLFGRMLRMEAEAIGLEKDFTIYDSEDSKKLIKKVLKELSLSEERYPPMVVLNRISGAKNRLLIDAGGYERDTTCGAEDKAVGKPHMGQIFTHYEARCRRAGALDFDDLLLRTYQLLRDHPQVAAKYQERFRYILVDEFQDTNRLQYMLIKLLASKHGNVCVIGDDAQSIYAFRGADLTHMLAFKKDFPQMRMVKLTHNFRSTQHIVKAANALIGHNQQQLEKVLFTDNALGEPVEVVQHGRDLEEARYVARDIFETSQRGRVTYDGFAILYRTNRQSRLFEEALRGLGIDYKLRGGTSFYGRKEVKDMLAYLRLLVNSNDEQALERVINMPKRGIGPVTFAKVRALALDHGLTLFEALERCDEVVGPRLVGAIAPFVSLIKRYKAKLATEDAYVIAKGLAVASGLQKALHEEKSVEGVARHENLEELFAGISLFVQEKEGEAKSLSAYLQEVALMTGDEQEEGKPAVTLMTMHAAKGLEYDHVYVVGVEEGILPSARMIERTRGVEEERRLFYVALTRARKRVVVSYVMMRKQFEKYKPAMVSRFVGEIDEALLRRRKVVDKGRQRYTRGRTKVEGGKKKGATLPVPRRKSLVRLPKLSSVAASTPLQGGQQDFVVGMEVVHSRFGQGKVVEVSDSGHGTRLKVAFAEGRVRTLLAAFAKLTVA